MYKTTQRTVAFSSAFHDPSSKDGKQSNSMQTRALLNLDTTSCKLLIRAQELPIKGLIDNSCNAFEAVPERRAVHKLYTHFVPHEIKSECKYNIFEHGYLLKLILILWKI